MVRSGGPQCAERRPVVDRDVVTVGAPPIGGRGSGEVVGRHHERAAGPKDPRRLGEEGVGVDAVLDHAETGHEIEPPRREAGRGDVTGHEPDGPEATQTRERQVHAPQVGVAGTQQPEQELRVLRSTGVEHARVRWQLSRDFVGDERVPVLRRIGMGPQPAAPNLGERLLPLLAGLEDGVARSRLRVQQPVSRGRVHGHAGTRPVRTTRTPTGPRSRTPDRGPS